MEREIEEIIKQIRIKGYAGPIKKTEVERLLVKFEDFQKAKEKLIQRFSGVKEVNPQIRRIMIGHG